MKKRRRSRHPFRLILLFLLVAACLVGVLAESRLMPLVREYACASVERNATDFLNEAVTTVLSGKTDLYSDLITVTAAPDGAPCSVRTNIAGINLLKSEITGAVIRAAEALPFRDLSIPVGTVVGGPLLTGRGPGIPVRVQIAGSVLSTLFSEFAAAGINQTVHRLYLKITARFFIALPAYHYASVEVTSDFLVAETVLVGHVPDAYTAVTDGTGDLIGKIFDYADIDL